MMSTLTRWPGWFIPSGKAGDGRVAVARILTSPASANSRRTRPYHPAVSETWDRSAPGILRLPSGRLVRGRALSRPLPDGPVPAFGVYLLGRRPPAVPWESRWIKWPDFRLPADEADVLPALTEAWQRAVAERVEIACAGGHGRTGTALACLAILDGVPGTEAVAFVREHYDRHAVETPAQRRYVAHWPGKRE